LPPFREKIRKKALFALSKLGEHSGENLEGRNERIKEAQIASLDVKPSRPCMSQCRQQGKFTFKKNGKERSF